jgi:effector-binding domain-containing protein
VASLGQRTSASRRCATTTASACSSPPLSTPTPAIAAIRPIRSPQPRSSAASEPSTCPWRTFKPSWPTAPADLAHVSVPATTAAAITDTIDIKDAQAWYHGALGELHASLASQAVTSSGPAGGIYSNDLFAEHRGEATVFLPCELTFRATGRIDPLVIPAVELATTTHAGPHGDIDRSYGALATYVAHHALSIDGPIREYYLVDCHTTTDPSQWRTQIGWPIFHTARPS